MTDPNDCAFVEHTIHDEVSGIEVRRTKSLTKRELIAALMMSAYVAREDMTDFVLSEKAACACVAADALISELNK